MLKRPGRCQSNGGRFKRGIMETSSQSPRPAAPELARSTVQQQILATGSFPEAGKRQGNQAGKQSVARQEQCRFPASSKGQFSWWSSLSQKELSCGIHPAESHALCTHQNRCGNTDRAPTKICSHPGLRLQGLPEPFTTQGWQ